MKKYNIKYERDNVFVSRFFPEIKETISRVTARLSGLNLENEIKRMKREILKEARSLGFREC